MAQIHVTYSRPLRKTYTTRNKADLCSMLLLSSYYGCATQAISDS